jgi:hypothetical protein
VNSPRRSRGGADKRGAGPAAASPGFSLSRHSMKAAVSLDKLARPQSGGGSLAPGPPPDGFSLRRRSYTPTMQGGRPGSTAHASSVFSPDDASLDASPKEFSLGRRSAAPRTMQQVEPLPVVDEMGSKPNGLRPPPGFSLSRASAGPRLGCSQRAGKAVASTGLTTTNFATGPLFQQQTRANVANASIQLARASVDPNKRKTGRLGHMAPSEQSAGPSVAPTTTRYALQRSHDDSEVSSERPKPPAGFSLRRSSMGV